jgi:hypothetical protein
LRNTIALHRGGRSGLLAWAVVLGLALATTVAAAAPTGEPRFLARAESGHSSTASPTRAQAIDDVARSFIELCFQIDRIDPGFVDSYYGSAELRRRAARAVNPTARGLRARSLRLLAELDALPGDARTLALRGQILAASTRLRMLAGEKIDFDDQLRGLFGLEPPRRFEAVEYEPARATLDRLLPPGPGGLEARWHAFEDRYTVPPERVAQLADTVVADLRRMSRAWLDLPEDEGIEEIRFVSGPSWGAYNWYLGGGRSRIEINKDQPQRAAGLALALAHETYFGHHAEATLREAELYKKRGWVEYSILPLYSPLSVVSEGAADAGVDVMLDDQALGQWLAQRVFPAAGLPDTLSSQVEIDRWLAVRKAREALSGFGCQVAELMLDEGLPNDEAANLRMRYLLSTREQAERSNRFVRDYGTYSCTYGAGAPLVRAACEAAAARARRAGEGGAGARAAARQRFKSILTEPTWPEALLRSLSAAGEPPPPRPSRALPIPPRAN